MIVAHDVNRLEDDCFNHAKNLSALSLLPVYSCMIDYVNSDPTERSDV